MTEPGNERHQETDSQAPPCRAEHSAGRLPAMNALIAASRINRGTVMDDKAPLTDPEMNRILTRARTLLDSQEDLPRGVRMSKAKLAMGIGESKSTFSQVLSGKYPKSKTDGHRKRDEILRKLDQHLGVLEERAHSPEQAGFAWTALAEEINAVAKTTVMLNCIGAVWSPAGCGKTLTAEALLSVYPGSVLITIDDSSDSPASFLRELTEALRVRAHRFRHARFKAVAQGLRDSKRLVMIDEAHLASKDVLNVARQLQDKAKFPLLLLGMPSLSRSLVDGRGDDSKGATIYSRIRVSRDLTERCRQGGDRGAPLFSVDDIKKVFARSKLRIAADGITFLQGLANLPEVGALRACTSAVLLAIVVAQNKGASFITRELLQQTIQLQQGTEGARAIANRIQALRKTA